MARLLRTYPNATAHSRLNKPAVIGAGIAFHGPGVRLAAPDTATNVVIRRAPHSILRKPAVIGAGIVFAPVQINYWAAVKSKQNTQLQRRAPYYRLSPPVRIGNGIVFRGILRTLALSAALAERDQRRQPRSVLRDPTVVGAGISFSGPRVLLAPSKRGKPSSRLSPPSVIGGGISFSGPRALLSRSRAGRAKSFLSPPAAVTPSTSFTAEPVRTQLSYSSRGRASSHLYPAIIPPLAPAIRANFVRTRPAQTHSILHVPVVVGNGIVFRPVLGHLAYSVRGKPKSRLSPPAVVGSGIFFRGLISHLAYSRRGKPVSHLFAPAIEPVFPGLRVTFAASRRGKPRSHLSPPAVVGAGVVFRPLDLELAYSRRGAPKSHLFAPAVIGAGVYFRSTDVTLAPSRRGKPTSRLSPPTVIGAGISFSGPRTLLVRSTRGRPKSILRPPVAIVSIARSEVLRLVQLARIRPQAVHSELRPPTVVANVAFAPISVHLAPAARQGRAVHSDIGGPVVVDQLEATGGIATSLARIRPAQTRSRLTAPTVVQAAAVYQPPVRVDLVRIRPVQVHSRLRPAAVVLTAVLKPIDTSLAPSSRGRPKSILRPAVIPGLAAPIRVTLVRIRPVRTNSILRKGIVGAGIVFRPIRVQVSLRVQVEEPRRAPHSHLYPPAVVATAPAFLYPIRTKLQPSPKQARATHSHLLPPAIVGAGVVFRALDTTLAPSRRVRVRSRLAPPILQPSARPVRASLTRIRPVRVYSHLTRFIAPAVSYRPVDTTLAPSTRLSRRPLSHLFVPAVVGAGLVNRPIQVYLVDERASIHSRLSERAPHSHLRPPVVMLAAALARPVQITIVRRPAVRVFSNLGLPLERVTLARPIQVMLVRIRPVRVRSFLRPSQVTVTTQAEQTLTVHLAPSRRQVGRHHLGAPTVVRPAEPYLRPIKVTLAPSARRRPHSFLTHILIKPFVPLRGNVCGSDVSSVFVCDLQGSTRIVFGGTSAGMGVSGTSAATTRITGTQRSSGGIFGGDRKAT